MSCFFVVIRTAVVAAALGFIATPVCLAQEQTQCIAACFDTQPNQCIAPPQQAASAPQPSSAPTATQCPQQPPTDTVKRQDAIQSAQYNIGAAELATAAPFCVYAAAPPAQATCAVILGGASGIYWLISAYYGYEAVVDPPDFNYTIIPVPVQGPFLPVVSALPPKTAAAMNALLANETTMLGLLQAMYMATNRASTAEAAGDVIWPQRQRQAHAAFQVSLGDLLQKEVKRRQALVEAFHAEGLSPAPVSPKQFKAFQSSIAGGWSPEQRAQLANSGADETAIETARQLALVLDPRKVVGQFPDFLVTPDSLTQLRTSSSVFKGIRIEIGGPTHRVSPRERRVLNVEVISTPTFDVSTIDPLSVRFGPNAASETFAASFEHANKEGLLELVFHFRSNETGITCGDMAAVMTGKLLNGDRFVGRGAVRTVDCNDDDDGDHHHGTHRNGGHQRWILDDE